MVKARKTGETSRYYITKFALTDGIQLVEATQNEFGGIFTVGDGSLLSRKFFRGNDFHINIATAIARAEDMRNRKLISLRKQIARLEALRFDHLVEKYPE